MRQDDQHRQEALVYFGIELGLLLLVSWVGCWGWEGGLQWMDGVQAGGWWRQTLCRGPHMLYSVQLGGC